MHCQIEKIIKRKAKLNMTINGQAKYNNFIKTLLVIVRRHVFFQMIQLRKMTKNKKFHLAPASYWIQSVKLGVVLVTQPQCGGAVIGENSLCFFTINIPSNIL